MRTELITENEVTELVSVRDAYEQVVHAHQALSRGDAVNIIRARARSGDMSLHSMSALDRSRNYAGAKVYSALGRMIDSHFLLYRVSNGEMLSILEAREIGRLRTAAATTIALKSLPSNPVKTIGLIGTGYQGEGLVRSLAEFKTDLGYEKLYVSARSPEKTDQFCNSMQKKYGVDLIPTTSAEELCGLSEAVCTATSTTTPIIEAEWLKNTRLVCALGANALIRRELATRVVTGANIVVVDETEVAKAEGGNILPAIETGKLQWRNIWELGAVLCGRTVPTLQKGWTVFCSHGLALQDLALASLVYERYISRGYSKGALGPINTQEDE